MKTTKVAFFGTSDRSKPILECLHENFNLILCATKSDRIVGRDRKSEETVVKKWANERGIDVFEIASMKLDAEDLLKQLESTEIDLIVVADFGFMVPKTIVEVFRNKIMNIHFSLLPKYRGASPVQAAIIQGEKETGVTFLLMTEELDSGDILTQIKHPLTGNETSGELYQTLFLKAKTMLPETVDEFIKGTITPRKQDKKNAFFYYSPSHPKSTYIYKEDAQINWNDPIELIERKIRAFSPWPIAWTYLGELKEIATPEGKIDPIKIRDSIDENLTLKIHSAKLEKGIDGRQALQPIQVQVSGKNKIKWEEFRNGYSSLS